MLNAIDYGLREQRQTDAPFGGVRVIAFGDTHQLPPVINERGQDDRLRDAFGGAFFFHAPAARSMTMVELTEVFRQKDPRFVDILNQVREGAITDEALAALNARVGAGAAATTPSQLGVALHDQQGARPTSTAAASLPFPARRASTARASAASSKGSCAARHRGRQSSCRDRARS